MIKKSYIKCSAMDVALAVQKTAPSRAIIINNVVMTWKEAAKRLADALIEFNQPKEKEQHDHS